MKEMIYELKWLRQETSGLQHKAGGCYARSSPASVNIIAQAWVPVKAFHCNFMQCIKKTHSYHNSVDEVVCRNVMCIPMHIFAENVQNTIQDLTKMRFRGIMAIRKMRFRGDWKFAEAKSFNFPSCFFPESVV